MFGRRPAPEPALTRDEVLDIFGGLADIHANTLEILRILGRRTMKKRTPEDVARSEEIGRRLRERVARIEAELADKAKEAGRRRRRLFGLLAL